MFCHEIRKEKVTEKVNFNAEISVLRPMNCGNTPLCKGWCHIYLRNEIMLTNSFVIGK